MPSSAPPSNSCCLAIEIGGTKTQLVVATPDARIVDRRRFHVDQDHGAAGIRASVADTLPELIRQWRPQAIGVGFGGPVDRRTGRIATSHHVAGWDAFPLADWLADIAHLPVFVENDANVAALGEAWHGAGRGHDPVFYVTIGSGVGGGLVRAGDIFHGAPPGEAEIGHLRLDAAGRTCESLCSGWSLDRRIRESVAALPEGELARRVRDDPGHEARHLGGAIAAGDPLAARILDDTTRWLAVALSHVAHLVHPDVVVLGGGVALLGEPLRSAVAAHLRGLVMDAFQPGPRVALAELREDAVPVGAVTLATRRVAASG